MQIKRVFFYIKNKKIKNFYQNFCLFVFYQTQNNTTQIHYCLAAAAHTLFQFTNGMVSMFALFAATTINTVFNRALLADAIRFQALSTLAATITANILTLFTRAAASTIRGRTLDAMTEAAAHSTRALLACRIGSSEESRAGNARHC